MTDPRYLTQADYARLRGWAKSRVTALKQAGRLVLTPLGRVDVAASDALIADTGGTRPDVAQRVAQARPPRRTPARAAVGSSVNADPAPPASTSPPDPATDPATDAADSPAKGAGADLRRRREETRRQAKLIELGLLRGALLERDTLDRVAADLGVTLRAALEAAVERLAPVLAAAPTPAAIAALTATELTRERRRFTRALTRAGRELANVHGAP